MSKNKNRRQQTPKSANPEWMRAKQEHLRSNVAVPHRNKAKYRRVKAGARGRDW